jgi:galactonate dehydratase
LKITGVETFPVDAGWKTYGFVKVTTDGGADGWSEFSPAFAGLTGWTELTALAGAITGLDVESSELADVLATARRHWEGQHAAGALTNAMLEAQARHDGTSVRALLGGGAEPPAPIRAYWAHCGTYRTSHAPLLGTPHLRTLDDVAALGREVSQRGFASVKINPLVPRDGVLRRHKPTLAQPATIDETRRLVAPALRDQIAALRDGAGTGLDVMVDLGSGYTVETASVLAPVLNEAGVAWTELEALDALSLSRLKDAIGVPLATGERLLPEQYEPLLASGALEVMVIDVLFHGLAGALEIARTCAGHGTTVAPHNCYGPLATLIAGTFCALSPNYRIMELDVDAVAWDAELLSSAPVPVNGTVALPDGRGWGTEVDPQALRAHSFEAVTSTRSE